MVKVAISSTKYIILGEFSVDGYIDKPDLIGAFFGQTEGLIGESLEFQNLQKSGKIGRIEIFLKKGKGNVFGKFTIPTALDRVEVSLVAAAIESINKIGHCSGNIKITQIKDDREEKRILVQKRAEELLANIKHNLPVSSEITLNIAEEVSKKDIKKYGVEIYGGPNIETDEEIILVEGRADVLNLLKCGISNVLSINGSKFSQKISKLIAGKEIIAFLDDDNAGHNELKVLKDKLDIDYFCFPNKGREVEDLNYKEIMKCLKNKEEINKDNKKNDFNSNIINKLKSLVSSTIDDKIVLDSENINKIEKNNKNIKLNKDIKTIDFKKNEIRNHWTKPQFEKITHMINSIKNTGSFIVLNKNYRRIKSDNISEILFFKSEKAKILIIDGIAEKSVLKVAKENNIEFIISKSKSKIINSNIKIKLFKEFE